MLLELLLIDLNFDESDHFDESDPFDEFEAFYDFADFDNLCTHILKINTT